MDILQTFLERIGVVHILVIFLIVELAKFAAAQKGKDLGLWAILIAVFMGVFQAYFWRINILPDPPDPRAMIYCYLVTGIIMAIIASGVFSWLKNLLPIFGEYQNTLKFKSTAQPTITVNAPPTVSFDNPNIESPKARSDLGSY